MYVNNGGRFEHWGLALVTPPAEEPLDVSEAKTHLRIDFPDDDFYIQSLIVAARLIVEERTGRALITQTWDMILDRFPDKNYIILKMPNLQSVISIQFKDASGHDNTVAETDYIVDTVSTPGRIVLAFGKLWPCVTLQPAAAVVIRYVSGYGTAETVPQPIKQAMLFLISHWYENREPVTKDMTEKIPMTFDFLIGPYRVVRFQ